MADDKLTEEEQAIRDLENDDGAGEDDQQGAESPDVEALAREMGWAPADEWRGDPEKHVDARTFIKTGPEILKTTLRKQDEKLDAVNETLQGMTRAAKSAEQRAYDRAVADLKTEQEEAVADGDVAEFKRLDNEIDRLAPPAADTEGGIEARAEADFKEFRSGNEWYGKDYELSVYADGIAPHVGEAHQGPEFYEELGKAVREKFPEKFVNSQRQRPASVEGGGDTDGTGGKVSAKTYKDLPMEAKQACDEFVEDGVLSQADYVKDYFATDEETA